MNYHYICKVDELLEDKPKIIEIDGKSIGIIHKNGKYYAIRNECPHRLSPLCKGTLGGTMLPSNPQEYKYGMDGQVIQCPWHGWEFDLETGKALFETSKLRVTTYPVELKNDEIYVVMN